MLCPFCPPGTDDDPGGDCPHLLLALDETFREPVSGALFEAFRERWSSACSLEELWDDEEDNGDDTRPARDRGVLLSRPRRPFDESLEFAALQDELDRLSDDRCWLDDEGGPGQSSSLECFHTRDPSRVGELEERLLDGPVRPSDRVTPDAWTEAWVRQTLQAVGEAATADGWPREPVQCALPRVGDAWSGALMVVVREHHDGANGIVPAALADAGRARAWSWQLEHDRDAAEDEDCPMAWVARQWGDPDPGLNTRRHAVWRVLREVAHGLRLGGDDDWSSHLAWSTLHKVAAGPGSPLASRLRTAQRAGARRVLALEQQALAPQRMLLLTGWSWAEPFLADAHMRAQRPGPLVEAMGRWNGTDVVVACHPQGRPELHWVKEVLAAFRTLGR